MKIFPTNNWNWYKQMHIPSNEIYASLDLDEFILMILHHVLIIGYTCVNYDHWEKKVIWTHYKPSLLPLWLLGNYDHKFQNLLVSWSPSNSPIILCWYFNIINFPYRKQKTSPCHLFKHWSFHHYSNSIKHSDCLFLAEHENIPYK